MTYCVGMTLDKGLVMMSDTRTNSGVDNISTFRKMHHWEVAGERIVTLMTAGNLATTQAIVSLLEERTKPLVERQNSLLKAQSMFQVASIVGDLLQKTVQHREEHSGQDGAAPELRGQFHASIIVSGQIRGMAPRLFLIYPEGNFIEASFDTPFFQIGETKYGRPIILRGYESSMSFENAVKLLMVSFDSTLKANLSVGLPLDLMVIERDNFEPTHKRRIGVDDPYYRAVSVGWSESLKLAFESLPDYSFFQGKDA